MELLPVALLLATLATTPGPAPGPPPGPPDTTVAQPGRGIRLTAVPGTAGRGRVILQPVDVLGDATFEEAVRSGLPLRFRYRVELWRDRFIAQLVAQQRWSVVLLFDPIDRDFVLRDEADAGELVRRFPTFAAARAGLEAATILPLAPDRAGLYYYTAALDIETLSLSDLAELQRWLSGELHPAVSGGQSVGGALTHGARRLMIRMLRLPSRRYEARSDRFPFP
jgi:hypothetical protein